ncbi:hypothetical protein SAMN05216412_10698 [Nitrosospira multiformis]|uniref:MetA-pathway of phenol degradation n=1 Tax=Nitrosospira multiformis TaxID=1231 RepID=A0A1I0EBI0_9PROT|nr:hypothetical protein SAMN05216412_10698 [Nitrosospira multiformis]
MSAKFKSNEGWRKSSTREVKSKCLGLLLLLGGSCTSSAALLETDAELKKKLEILEARIAELEERLERTGGQKEDASPNFTLEKKDIGMAAATGSSNPAAPAHGEIGDKLPVVKTKVADVKPFLDENGWQEGGSKGHGFDRKKFHGGVTLKQDAFFGFQTILDAGYEITDNIDFTFYSWLWTSPNFGRSRVVAGPDGMQVDAGGNGLWTEVGMGLNFRFFDDALSINPQIGVLNGALLSSRIVGRGIRAAEGVVPNITINYDDDYFTGQGYFAYYAAIRDERARDFIHNWVSLGVKPALFNLKNFPVNSVGVHWEHLRFHVDRIDGAPGTLYNWIGPYVELALPMHLALRFAAGADLKGEVANEFYQASIKMHF